MKRLGLVLSVIFVACTVDPQQDTPSTASHESTTVTEAEPCPLDEGGSAGCIGDDVVRCADDHITSRQPCPNGCESVVVFTSDQNTFDLAPSDYRCAAVARDAGEQDAGSEPYDAGLRDSSLLPDDEPTCLEHHEAMITAADGDSCDHEPPTCAADGRTLLVCIQVDGETSGVWLPSPCDCVGGCTARQYGDVEVHACVGNDNVEIDDRDDGACLPVDDREFCLQ